MIRRNTRFELRGHRECREDKLKVYRFQQPLVAAPLQVVEAEVYRALDAMNLKPPQGDIAITAGSRGIANIITMIKAAGDWLKAHGARPFIVPAMGSHSGATADGQRSLLESIGLTRENTGMDIRASMDCVKVGEVDSGEVWMDRHAFESDGVLLVNRIKLHTAFSGPLQSGLTKMMVVGLGKIRSARTFHAARPDRMAAMLAEMGSAMTATGKIWAGLGILEDGYDQTAELHAMPGDRILEREPALVERCRRYFPALPCDDINVLVVDEIGKNFSGTGMDTNVIGRRGIRGFEDLSRPRINVIAALGLSSATAGNALGVGLADFITQRLRDAIDEQKTLINTLTTGEMQRMAIPCTLPDDETLIATIRERFGDHGWMFIPNTLHLETIYVTEDLAATLPQRAGPTPLPLQNHRLNLFPPSL